MTNTDPNEFLMQGGTPSFKFDKIGATVKGTIVSLNMQIQRDLNTGAPRTWDDGTPRKQLQIILVTDERDAAIDGDEGRRAIYVKGQMQQAVRDAIQKAGEKSIEEGGTLAVQYHGDGEPAKKGFNPVKLYRAQYSPPVRETAAVGVEDLL